MPFDPPLVSACVITFNEEVLLEGCLASVAPHCDELVVVDAFSTDRTVEIARSFGAKVISRAWTEDFSAARNEAIDAARGRWVLCIDADELLIGGDRLRPLLESTAENVGGYVVERHDLVNSPDTGRSEVRPQGVVRLLRRLPELRYSGRAHPRAHDSLRDAGLALRRATSFRLHHLVKEIRPERLRERQARYLRLLDAELAARPHDWQAHHQRGLTLWRLRDVGAARSAFQHVAAHPECEAPTRAFALCALAQLDLEDGRPEAGLSRTTESLALHPSQSFAWCVRGELLQSIGRYGEAAEAYSNVQRSCEPAGADQDVVPGDVYWPEEKRAWKIGSARLAAGDVQRAAEAFEAGLRASPEDAGCLLGMSQVLRLQREDDRARELLERSIRADPGWRTPREVLDSLPRRRAHVG